MTKIREGNIVWTFPSGWLVMKFDDWAFYKNHFQSCGGSSKAMDLLALSPKGDELWMIEAKDYRQHHRKKKISLPKEVTQKAKDTLAAIFAASVNASGREKAFAREATKVLKIRVVLHLEQPTKPSKLFPMQMRRVDVLQKLKQLSRAIDPHPVVMTTTASPRAIPWTTTWDPPPP